MLQDGDAATTRVRHLEYCWRSVVISRGESGCVCPRIYMMLIDMTELVHVLTLALCILQVGQSMTSGACSTGDVARYRATGAGDWWQVTTRGSDSWCPLHVGAFSGLGWTRSCSERSRGVHGPTTSHRRLCEFSYIREGHQCLLKL